MKCVWGFLSLLVVLVHCQGPTAADPRVTNLLKMVNLNNIKTHTKKLVKTPNRFYWCGVNTLKTETYISKTFRDLGLTTFKDPFEYEGHDLNNVVATYKSTSTNKIVVLGAHMDSYTKEGYNNQADCSIKGPGALDNAAGVAALLEIARILATEKPQLDYNVQFVAFGCGEDGYKGSLAYKNRIIKNLQGRRSSEAEVIGALNADVIGYSSKLWVWKTRHTTQSESTYLRQVYNQYDDTIDRDLVFQDPDPVWTGGSDNLVLQRAFDTTFLTSTAEKRPFDYRFPEIHSKEDELSEVDFDLVQSATKLILAYAMHRAELSGSNFRTFGSDGTDSDGDIDPDDENATSGSVDVSSGWVGHALVALVGLRIVR